MKGEGRAETAPPMRAVVADDSVVFRRVVAQALERVGVAVVATASNGRQVLERIRDLNPDLVTLDIEMPGLDGLEVLDRLWEQGSDATVIVISGHGGRTGVRVVRALERGAFDLIAKPDAASIDEAIAFVAEALRPRVAAAARRREVRALLGSARDPMRGALPPAPAPEPQGSAAPRTPPRLVLIGVSTGGPRALACILPALPRDLGVPVLIVQHMPPRFTGSLADALRPRCEMDVREAQNGEPVSPNVAYIAPGGRHMALAMHEGEQRVRITDDPPENNCRPAADYLFRSAAFAGTARSVAVILTGMGSDGVAGARLVRNGGGYVIAQDEASCVVYGMPRAAVEAGVVDAVVSLDGIAARIVALVRGDRT